MKHAKTISVLLCLVLLAVLLPMTALAEDPSWALLVDGHPVRESNKDDVLKNGVFSFCIREVKVGESYRSIGYLIIHGDYTAKNDGPLIENRKLNGLRIMADCPSKLTASGTVLSCGADTTLMGFAGLTLNSETGSCVEVYNGKKLTLHGVDLKANAAQAALTGSETGERLALAGSVLELDGGQGAILGFDGGIDLHETCTLREPDAAQLMNGALREGCELSDSAQDPEILRAARFSTYADLDEDGAVTVQDLLEFVVRVANDPDIIDSILNAFWYGSFDAYTIYDFDVNGRNGRGDFQFFIDRLFPDGAAHKIVLCSYEGSTGRFLSSFAFDRIGDVSLETLADFLMRKAQFRMFILGENNVPICQSALVDRTKPE